MKNPSVYKKLPYDSIKDFARLLVSDLERWAKVVRRAGVQAE